MTRIPAGRVNGIHAPDGTILGPKEVTREPVTVIGQDDAGVTVGYATTADLAAVEPGPDGPRSLTEARAWMAADPARARLRYLFGGLR